ncbi:hypothetical protein DM01DRAFT_1337136 [Hesseltinella vesiculosa]|uniref:Cysteine-rich transmembrane CYSTM domain-containing protein n=1 Tax=Hesseltinella vesiculosa TaxID=101127 RepID=A0A1X2GDZ0_9FUNG|nr:hypothetical protein DM01DRAFT_1337136 [Hesseltinella vesiculosa]
MVKEESTTASSDNTPSSTTTHIPQTIAADTTDEKKKPLSHVSDHLDHSPPPPAYQASVHHHHSLSHNRYSQLVPSSSVYFYQPTPAPQTVIVHDTPSRSKDACCWGCVAGLILCFGAKEFCF